ncbi:MAG TPA: RNA polymerase subunit sigma-70 [Lachnospiraceae bacterium]|nr:RNA polymerase subunit sigma-70 [Lachnospiraceae bacterium]
MTNEQKEKILMLRSQGLGYKKIASEVTATVDSVKSFLRRNQNKAIEYGDGCCKECGKPIEIIPKTKTKKFCSDFCRSVWWSKNRFKLGNTKMITITCKCCGKEFRDYSNQNRKYCSRRCYLKSRFGGEYDE